jgi:hypothetical protein
MTRTGKWILGGTLAALLMGGAGLAVADGMRRHGWGAHGGGMMGPGFGMMERACGPRRAERIDAGIGMVESFARFDATQRPAWDELKAAIGRAQARVDEGCKATAALRASGATEPPARLAMMEAMLSTGLDALREVRPAADKLYATLSPEQKAALQRFMERGPRRGPPPPPDAAP